MAGGIFISYRRDDAKHAAGRLVDRLGRTFVRDQLFFDIDNIEPGLDFKKVLSEKVEGCDVLLAVIGPDWISSKDELGARRLDSLYDFVRVEIEAALARGVRVIPVLVDGARMPKESELPETMRPLTYRNAVRLTHERFAADAGDLSDALSRIVTTAPVMQTSTLPAMRRKYSFWGTAVPILAGNLIGAVAAYYVALEVLPSATGRSMNKEQDAPYFLTLLVIVIPLLIVAVKLDGYPARQGLAIGATLAPLVFVSLGLLSFTGIDLTLGVGVLGGLAIWAVLMLWWHGSNSARQP